MEAAACRAGQTFYAINMDWPKVQSVNVLPYLDWGKWLPRLEPSGVRQSKVRSAKVVRDLELSLSEQLKILSLCQAEPRPGNMQNSWYGALVLCWHSSVWGGTISIEEKCPSSSPYDGDGRTSAGWLVHRRGCNAQNYKALYKAVGLKPVIEGVGERHGAGKAEDTMERSRLGLRRARQRLSSATKQAKSNHWLVLTLFVVAVCLSESEEARVTAQGLAGCVRMWSCKSPPCMTHSRLSPSLFADAPVRTLLELLGARQPLLSEELDSL
eukprot:479519-Pelagomonas_calceolata.AAC.2